MGCGNKPDAKRRRSKGAAGVVLGQCMLAEVGGGKSVPVFWTDVPLFGESGEVKPYDR